MLARLSVGCLLSLAFGIRASRQSRDDAWTVRCHLGLCSGLPLLVVPFCFGWLGLISLVMRIHDFIFMIGLLMDRLTARGHTLPFKLLIRLHLVLSPLLIDQLHEVRLVDIRLLS